MRGRLSHVVAAVPFLALATTTLATTKRTYFDLANDARVRRTDLGADGALGDGAVLPDLISITSGGWSPASPATDPYTGVWVESEGADILRIDIVFEGLINPPGTLGLGPTLYDPFAFGPSPLYGSIEFDIDDENDTGGECSGAANFMYLASVGRLGEVPGTSIEERMAREGEDLDSFFASEPQYERNGADYVLRFCGCANVTVINDFGDPDGVFGPDDSWIVQSRFFQRAGGFAEVSGAFGGSAFGLYDPQTNLRFSHSISTGQTTVTLVYPLTMHGAASLRGEPEQPADTNVANHTSVEEAMSDVIAGVQFPIFDPCTNAIAAGWRNRQFEEYINPAQWRIRAVVGTAYESEDPGGALYIWTDAGFNQQFADFSSDRCVTPLDENLLLYEIAELDGTGSDADGVVNGVVTLYLFGANFSVFDLNYDGLISPADAVLVEPILAGDVNSDCIVNVNDLNMVLSQWGNAVAPAGKCPDLSGNGIIDVDDLNVVLSSWGLACP
ncbi:MAG: hypothetical protein KDA16_04705 [Phycisphaerales bacterium]|nr:hypothetical protein [Phycisphaerales bacterium]